MAEEEQKPQEDLQDPERWNRIRDNALLSIAQSLARIPFQSEALSKTRKPHDVSTDQDRLDGKRRTLEISMSSGNQIITMETQPVDKTKIDQETLKITLEGKGKSLKVFSRHEFTSSVLGINLTREGASFRLYNLKGKKIDVEFLSNRQIRSLSHMAEQLETLADITNPRPTEGASRRPS